MSHLHDWLDFTTVEEGEQKLKQAEETRDKMGSSIFWQILERGLSGNRKENFKH